MTDEDWDEFFRDGKEQEAVHYAKRGDPTLLIALIEAGEEIGPVTRKFLVSHLKRNAGRRNLWVEKQKRMEVANSIWLLARMNGWSRGEAVRAYLASHPDTNDETLKTWLREFQVGELEGLPPLPEISVEDQEG